MNAMSPSPPAGAVQRRIAGALLVWMAAAMWLAGCGNSTPQPPPVPEAPGPLTVEEWKAIGDPSKYAPETLERLRAHDPGLQSNARWQEFVREVVNPEFRREFRVPDSAKVSSVHQK